MKRIIVGKFGKVFGIRGWLTVISFTSPRDNILELMPWQVHKDSTWQKVSIEAKKINDKNILVKLANCDDRTFASAYTNSEIAISREQLPELKSNEYYWTDLEGLTVINQKNIELGTVAYLFATGANDLLVVKENKAEKPRQRLIPFIKDVILSVDMEKRVIKVVWDENLL